MALFVIDYHWLLLIPGGLTAVIYTDALQTVIMVIGAFVLMFIGTVFMFSIV